MEVTIIKENGSSTKKPNRLISQKSPYLIQHAYNPVDWHFWGQEAFEKVRNEDKPFFLSIGYSTCHWCHVMEKESFENGEVVGKFYMWTEKEIQSILGENANTATTIFNVARNSYNDGLGLSLNYNDLS